MLFLFKTFIVLMLLSVGAGVQAARVEFLGPETVPIGAQFSIDVVLDTEGERINAVGGRLSMGRGPLSLQDARTGKSVVSFWVEDPKASGNEVAFSGLIPGGFTGSLGTLFSVTLVAGTEGFAELSLEDIEVLIDDGEGTSAETNTNRFVIQVLTEGTISQEYVIGSDTDIPEPFEASIIVDSDVFDGKRFVVFATQDKGSGVSYYEVAETREGEPLLREWVRSTSPHQLIDQTGNKRVFVKAVDWSGNIRVVEASHEEQTRPYLRIFLSLGILVLVVLVFVLKRRFFAD